MKAALISLGSTSSKWIAEAMQKYFDQVDSIQIKFIELNLASKGTEILYKGERLPKYDCVYVRGSYRYANLLGSITSALKKETFVPFESSSFQLGHDKIMTHIKLQEAKVPMPATYLSSSITAAKKILERLNYPIIMKLPSGTQGKGVLYADSFASASSILDTLETLKQPFLIQEYVDTGGVDIRAIVVGDKVVGCMKRIATNGEQRANIHAGGKGEPHQLDYYGKKIAVEAAKAVGAEICAVDLLDSPKGPLVIEVNLSPGIQGITQYTKIDIADYIAKYLHKRTKEICEKGKEGTATKILQEVGIQNGNKQQIITNVDFRGKRILLPEVVTRAAKFTETNEVVIKYEDGKVIIEKFDM